MSDTRQRSLWLSPVGWFLYGAILLLCLGSILLLWKVKQRGAERDFDRFAAAADALPDPRESLRRYNAYIQTHHENELTRRAEQKAGETQDRIAKFDFDQAARAAEQTGEDYESAIQIWQAYLNSQLAPAYRSQAEQKLQELPPRIDDRDFARIDKQYPAATPDLETRRAAMEAYLTRFPQGRHVDAARKTIAQIPDALDQRAYQAVADEVAGLVAANKTVEAIECLDAKSAAVTSQQRKDRLQRTRQALVADLEQQDLKRILTAPMGDAAQQRAVLSACRLFLLVYPESKQAPDVRKRMAAVIENLGIAEWRAVQQPLDSSAAKPDAAVRAIDDYLRVWPDALAAQSIREAVYSAYVRAFLARLADAPWPQTGTILLKDGTTVFGVVEEMKDLYKVTDPGTGQRLPSVWKDRVQSYTPSAASQAATTLRKQLAAMNPQNPDRSVLRAAANLARQHQLRQAAWLLCSLLARIDSDSTETQRLLESNGFWRVGNRWLSQEDMSDTAIFARLLDHFGHSVVDGVKQAMKQLPLNVKFSRLGVDETVPVDCTPELARTDLQSRQQDADGLKATIRFRFKVSLQPQGGADDQAIRRLAADIASKAECEAILEINEQRASHGGAGVVVELHAGSWTVSQIDPRGPASSAWVEVGDAVVAVNGRTLDEQTPQQEILDLLAGTTGEAELKLRRNNRAFTVKLTKGEWSESVFQARYYIRHNLNSGGVLQFLPQTSLPPVSSAS